MGDEEIRHLQPRGKESRRDLLSVLWQIVFDSLLSQRLAEGLVGNCRLTYQRMLAGASALPTGRAPTLHNTHWPKVHMEYME